MATRFKAGAPRQDDYDDDNKSIWAKLNGLSNDLRNAVNQIAGAGKASTSGNGSTTGKTTATGDTISQADRVRWNSAAVLAANAIQPGDNSLNIFRLIGRYTANTSIAVTASGRIEVECSAGSVVITLPDPATLTDRDGLMLLIIKDDGTMVMPGTTVTIQCAGTGTIRRQVNEILSGDNDSTMLICSAQQNNWIARKVGI